ncbi:MAG: hypothetical protein CVU08_04805 [Bacteroidetes bacterium HGW-Bacteroidetes-3]|nr:MAG: hypothetical protein CVU08_04805 [Bacteroidetes bacterium HGW-Bacteroidetes-3]
MCLLWVGFFFLREGEKNKINSIKFALTYLRTTFYTCIQRFAAWRSGGFRSTNVQFSTNVYLKTECSI